jgi:hypothetical protein
MKLDSLLARLNQIKAAEENGEFGDFEPDHVSKVIIQALIEYLNNPKIEEAINEISF